MKRIAMMFNDYETGRRAEIEEYDAEHYGELVEQFRSFSRALGYTEETINEWTRSLYDDADWDSIPSDDEIN